MAYAGNSPRDVTIIKAEARKSLSIAVWITDTNGRPLDLTGTVLRIVAKKRGATGGNDAANLFTNSQAELVDAVNGFARFSLQAHDLDHAPGEYAYAIVLWSEGYSSAIVKGIIDIQPNTEWDSLTQEYLPDQVSTALTVVMSGNVALEVRTGSTLAPGTTSFTDEDKRKLDTVAEGAQVNVGADWNAVPGDDSFIFNKPPLDDIAVPPGGMPGEMLIKLTNSDYDTGWAQPPSGGGGGGSGLDATGVLAGRVPTANGLNGWSWAAVVAGVSSVAGMTGAVTLTLNDIANSSSRFWMSLAQRDKLNALTETPSWNSLVDMPDFGTMAQEDAETFIARGEVDIANDISSGILPITRAPRVSELRGFSWGTAVPTGGSDGDLYFQYTP